jgi:multidrug efflux pump subunit AcrB
MIRSFIHFAVTKTALNHIFLLFLVVLAIFSYKSIPKEIFPPFSLDKVSITGAYAGASADVLDKMIVNNLEDELKNISEIELISTTIQNGMFTIIGDIKANSNTDFVLNDTKDIISKLKRDLPSDMEEPTAKIVESVIPLVLIAIAGENATQKDLIARADELKSKLAEFDALSDITIRGDADEQLVIRLRDDRIDGYGLDHSSVSSAIKNISSIFPIGTIKEQGKHLYLSTLNGEKDVESIENTLITVGDKKVYIKDIATVSFELETPSELSHYNGIPNVSININKSKEGNAIQLVKEIRVVLADFEKLYPQYQFKVYTDTSVWIKNRLNTVISNIIFGLFLVGLALFLTVNWGIAATVAMGIPMSFVIGLIAANAMGYSLNMLSLLGALIALGMLVDEAIVVAENIYRHMEHGKDRLNAVIDGATEMFPAVLTATLTTVFAFLPLLMLSGEMGLFMRILPIMISILLISSLFEAFYFLPLHAKEFLHVKKKPTIVASERAKERHDLWGRIYKVYTVQLRFAIRYKLISLPLIIVAIIFGTVILGQQTKFQLFPDFDTTQINVKGQVNINNELEETAEFITQIEKILLENLSKDDVSSITSVTGMKLDGKNKAEIGENLFQIFIDLHERKPDNVFNKYINPYLSPNYDESKLIRDKSAKDIAKKIEVLIQDFYKLKDKNNNLVFDELIVQVPGAGIVKSDVDIALTHQNQEVLQAGIDKLKLAISQNSGTSNIEDDAKEGETELKLRVNEYGKMLGFNETVLMSVLQPLYLKAEYSKMFNNSGLIRIKIEKSEKDYFGKLKNLNIHVPNSNKIVQLDEITDFIFEKSYSHIYKEDGIKIKSVFATLDKNKITSSELMKNLEATFRELRMMGIKVEIKGEAKENAKMAKEVTQAFLIAIFLIFITLIWMFDSIILSLIVLSTIPLSIFGVLLGHIVMGINMTMPGTIGIVGLAGVVVNDALIMVDFLKKAKNLDEVVEQSRRRVRPILLTSLTTVIGLSTLIFFASGQALILQPMAVSLGFGLAWATLLNLFYVPILYSVIYRIKEQKVPEPTPEKKKILLDKEENLKEKIQQKSSFDEQNNSQKELDIRDII